jgi:SAM-dependent methyltransferase
LHAETRQRLLEISARFYERHGASFDASRGRPWPGWSRLWESLRGELAPGGKLRCFDAGCGNGRFALFLHERLSALGDSRPDLRYVGVDLDAGLLASARRDLEPRLAATDFELASLDLADGDPPEIAAAASQDLVTLFGVLHHVPDEAVRRSILQRMATLLAPGGRLVASIWRLDQDAERFETKRVPWPRWNESHEAEQRICLEHLEDGDVLLSWRGDCEVPRYCHFPTNDEVERLVDLGPGLEPAERFEADGPTGHDNLYLTWRRLTAC